MKKRIWLIIGIVILLAAAIGVIAWTMAQHKEPSVPTPDTPSSSLTDSTSETSASTNGSVNKLTGLEDAEGISRPIAIPFKQDNAASLSGISASDAVYEIPSANQKSRLLGLYEGSALPKTGPIGTITNVLAQIARPFSPILLHNGTHSIDPSMGLLEVKSNQDSDAFSFSGSNAYTSQELLTNFINNHAIDKTVNHPDLFEFSDNLLPGSGSAQTITLPYGPNAGATFSYQPSSKKYMRSYAGVPQKDSNTNQPIGTDNLFILYTSVTGQANSDPTVGLDSGMGLYCHNGQYTNIMWSKYGSEDTFTFLDEEGSQLKVARGRSWICLFDQNQKTAVLIQ